MRALTVTALACLSAAPLSAQPSEPPLRLTRLTGPIELDGRLNEREDEEGGDKKADGAGHAGSWGES